MKKEKWTIKRNILHGTVEISQIEIETSSGVPTNFVTNWSREALSARIKTSIVNVETVSASNAMKKDIFQLLVNSFKSGQKRKRKIQLTVIILNLIANLVQNVMSILKKIRDASTWDAETANMSSAGFALKHGLDILLLYTLIVARELALDKTLEKD